VNLAQRLKEGTPANSDTIAVKSDRTDTTSIILGRRNIVIVEKDGKTDISISGRDDIASNESYSRSRPFKGHWSGIELGLNNYVNNDFSTSLAPGEDFMELRAAKSINLNINILQQNLTISDNNIGLVTGLGLGYNNYRFSNNVSIMKENREIVPVEYDELGIKLEKSRFRAIYLNVPLLLEFQTKQSRRSHRAYISAGVIGGVNIGSSTRVVYKDNSSRSREKAKDDFYLSPFRYAVTFRAGYRSLNIFANYYPTPLFQSGKGPELYPVSVGFSLFGF
jgi:hypothetical protein